MLVVLNNPSLSCEFDVNYNLRIHSSLQCLGGAAEGALGFQLKTGVHVPATLVTRNPQSDINNICIKFYM